ncbi:MAG TPA: 3-isopropylmalate dehydratase large subunit [Oceanospirillales bacterium]|nr:3-isopropylmalate dehydratase large subunit [Oceanospirillales bacterium]
MKKNIIDKIWDSHIVKQNQDHPAILAIDFCLIHEVTSAQAFATLRNKNLPVYDTKSLLATVDHSIPTRKNRHEILDQMAKAQVQKLRDNCKDFNIPFYDMDSRHQGIVHVVGPELGITQPGMTIVCGDSHTATHGAFGALAFGIGTSTVGHVFASGCLLMNKPKVMKVEFNGQFQGGVSAKDAIMKLIANIGIGGANGHIIEYTGSAIAAMSMEARMTLCNMSIECGAVAGLIAPDKVTYAYLQGKKCAPTDKWKQAISYWNSLKSDKDCHYDKEICINIDHLHPMVSWGTNPQQAIEINETIPQSDSEMDSNALNYVQLEAGHNIANTPLEWAFVGSCTNGRIEDLRVTAAILKDRKIANNMTFYVVPGSEQVMQQAQSEGLIEIINDSGAEFRMPGCSMCLAMNDDKVPAGKRCISSTNRNFVGRQGTGSITHLASPATVAASAIAGKIVSPAKYFNQDGAIT